MAGEDVSHLVMWCGGWVEVRSKPAPLRAKGAAPGSFSDHVGLRLNLNCARGLECGEESAGI